MTVRKKRVRFTPAIIEQCRVPIEREASYWARAFRGALDRNDLMQDGWVIAAKVLRYYDPMRPRAAAFTTLLTLALRQEFRRQITLTLRKALWPAEGGVVQADPFYHTSAAVEARLRLDLLWSANASAQDLALALLRHDGKISHVARASGTPVRTTRARVYALRALLERR